MYQTLHCDLSVGQQLTNRLIFLINNLKQIPYFRKILFLIWPYLLWTLVVTLGHSTLKCGNYSREETICGNTVSTNSAKLSKNQKCLNCLASNSSSKAVPRQWLSSL